MIDEKMKGKPHILQLDEGERTPRLPKVSVYLWNSSVDGTCRRVKREGEIKGKMAIKAAKRKRVKEMKNVSEAEQISLH